MDKTAARIPAIVNVKSGTADEAREALTESGAFDVHEVEPEKIASTVKELVGAGAKRLLVAGGDGTIATAAATLVDSPAELAVLPGGTLNHFARDLGISTVAAEAVELASSGSCRGVDVGMVTLHPSGLPHGPQPGTVEKALGATRTDELAVMWDTFRPLRLAALWRDHDEPSYAYSWNEDRTMSAQG